MYEKNTYFTSYVLSVGAEDPRNVVILDCGNDIIPQLADG